MVVVVVEDGISLVNLFGGETTPGKQLMGLLRVDERRRRED